MENAIYVFQTTINKKEYQALLYHQTFFQNPFVIPAIILLCIGGACITTYMGGFLTLGSVISSSIVLFVLGMGIIVSEVEKKHKRRLIEGVTSPVGNPMEFVFYADCMEVIKPTTKRRNLISYENFNGLKETKNLFLFDFDSTQIDILNKKDIKELEEFSTFIKEKFDGRYKKI
ncbi:MAG: hypothetical protein RR322_06040 [Oscillospiraceae bacterium]